MKQRRTTWTHWGCSCWIAAFSSRIPSARLPCNFRAPSSCLSHSLTNSLCCAEACGWTRKMLPPHIPFSASLRVHRASVLRVWAQETHALPHRPAAPVLLRPPVASTCAYTHPHTLTHTDTHPTHQPSRTSTHTYACRSA